MEARSLSLDLWDVPEELFHDQCRAIVDGSSLSVSVSLSVDSG